jgi:hypothetical protein
MQTSECSRRRRKVKGFSLFLQVGATYGRDEAVLILIRLLPAPYVFISYNNPSLLTIQGK